jgi:peroxiredoxin Q/BCP
MSEQNGSDDMPEAIRMPQVGEEAPPIEATATGDGPFSLADQRGSWVVVYFYPRANTPG